jgi:DNA invertase Pin-like site-specific DNA recombinase
MPTQRSTARRKRALVYVRMSDLKQEDSPERQLAQILPWCQAQGYDVVDVYTDLGVAGCEFERRPELLRLLKDAKDGKGDVVVCTKPAP